MADTGVILEMRHIVKEFPGVRALDGVTMRVGRATIHSIVGENGAGKSTLMKVLSGVYPHGTYQGDIVFDGEEMRFAGIKASEAAGIVIIHQEFTLIPELSITENIFLGTEVVSRGLIDWDLARSRALDLLARVGLDMDPSTPIKSLGVGQQQLVEIAKALSKDVKLLILDEPTSALNDEDSQNLLDLICSLKHKGITSIMITHKLGEVAQVSDAITVIRDGRTVEDIEVDGSGVDENQLIRAMVGRSIENRFPEHECHAGDVLMEVRDWTVESETVTGRLVAKGSDFHVRRGEIVGFAGLMGAGRTELVRSIFGHSYGRYLKGTLTLDGETVHADTVQKAIKAGLAYVPEDRKSLGLNLLDSVKGTILSANLEALVRHGLLDISEGDAVATRYCEDLRIKTPSIGAGIATLSGGNQQKAILAKWMYPDPKVLILDEPTRGIDVGAKYEIYKLIQALADAGKGVVVISSELPEVLGICDRIYAISEGQITGCVDAADADQESLMRLMTLTSSATADSTNDTHPSNRARDTAGAK